MRLQLLRHATLLLDYGSLHLLVDPMLSRAGALDPVQNAANTLRIPLVELPLSDADLLDALSRLDAALVTHTHRDHWDVRAAELLRRDLPILCQPEDADRLSAAGFHAVQPVVNALTWRGLTLTRTGGEHGTGEVGRKMGPVSGFVLRAVGEPVVYLAGDTVWCPAVEAALAAHQPDIAVVNTGAAQFLTGGPITMPAEDVLRVARARPTLRVIAIHLEAVNHCQLSRAELRAAAAAAGLEAQIVIPADGERLAL